MVKMTGGQALAKSLYREGVRVIFGLPGVQLYHMMDGLYDEPGIRLVPVRHEQSVTYMADGNPEHGNPSLRYITLLRDGAAAHGLPAAYLDYLNNVEPAS